MNSRQIDAKGQTARHWHSMYPTNDQQTLTLNVSQDQDQPMGANLRNSAHPKAGPAWTNGAMHDQSETVAVGNARMSTCSIFSNEARHNCCIAMPTNKIERLALLPRTPTTKKCDWHVGHVATCNWTMRSNASDSMNRLALLTSHWPAVRVRHLPRQAPIRQRCQMAHKKTQAS